MKEYNAYFGKKQRTPYIPQRRISFLSKEHFDCVRKEDYVVMAEQPGENCVMFFSSSGVFVILEEKTQIISEISCDILNGTIVSGKSFNDEFTGSDVIFIAGIDVRKKSLIKRLKYLKAITKTFPDCATIKYYNTKIKESLSKILDKYKGVAFVPVKANYINNRTYIYFPIEEVTINFKVVKHEENGFLSYQLLVNEENKLFTGTKNYPYLLRIPLCEEDRNFIDLQTYDVFQLRWNNNAFRLCKIFYNIAISTEKYAEQAWNYINEPFTIKDLLNHI